jgi:hypothetical protein
MKAAAVIALGSIMASKSGSVDPSKFPDEVFDLYSILAFDRGQPEIVEGNKSFNRAMCCFRKLSHTSVDHGLSGKTMEGGSSLRVSGLCFEVNTCIPDTLNMS